jgi:hypothetical protein
MIAVKNRCPKVGQIFLEKADKKPHIKKVYLFFYSMQKFGGLGLYLLHVQEGSASCREESPHTQQNKQKNMEVFFILIVSIFF